MSFKGPAYFVEASGRLRCPYCYLVIGQESDGERVFVDRHEAPCGRLCVGSAKKHWWRELGKDVLHTGRALCPACQLVICPNCDGAGRVIVAGKEGDPIIYYGAGCNRCDGLGLIKNFD